MILPILTPTELAAMTEEQRDLNWKIASINELLVSSLYTGYTKIELTANKDLSNAIWPLLTKAGYTVQKESLVNSDFLTITFSKP